MKDIVSPDFLLALYSLFIFNLYRSESQWSELKSDLDEWAFVKSKLINSLLKLWISVKLCQRI